MTTFELHLQVNQRYQEVASYKRDKFKPEEIDLALNKAMYRFLEKGVSSKFQDSQINLSHVAALIKKNKTADTFKPDTTDRLYEPYSPSVYALLPADYYWFVNGRAEVVTDIYNCDTAPVVPTVTKQEYITPLVFCMPTAATVTAPYFAKVDIITSTPVSTIYNSPYNEDNGIHTNFQSKRSKYVIINHVLERFYNRNDYKIYWNRYRSAPYEDTFVIVSDTNPGTITMRVYDANRSAINNTTSAVGVLGNYTIYNRAAVAEIEGAVTNDVPITVIQATDTYRALKQNPFYKTRSTDVLAEVDHDFIRLYTDESFIIPRIAYDYIRKPRTISLALNQSCELAATTHDKIVDLAVEILRLDTKDPAYPQTIQDTQIRTNQ